jgi:hypothetical protein
MADRSAELTSLLRTLKLPRMAAIYGELAMQAARENYTHEAFLYELARQVSGTVVYVLKSPK